jgi:holin-like protein
MLGLQGLAWILLMQSAGELVTRALSLPVPGPVVGLLILLLALRWPLIRAPVAACAQILLSNLSLLFVPVGVGVMTHLGLLAHYGLRILVVIVLSSWAALAVTVLILQWQRQDGDDAG